MTVNDFLKDLFGYNHHYNQELARQYLDQQEKVSEKSAKLFSHILNAHEIWNARLKGIQPAFKVWDIQPVHLYQQIDLHNWETSIQILEKAEMDHSVTYTNSKGKFTRPVSDILYHIVNHSTYHRGQIATDFRATGLEPLGTDFIFYKKGVK